jgi:hypothetical protein
LGSLLIGAVSQYIGAPLTLLAEGLAALGVVGVFWKYLREKETPVEDKDISIPIEDSSLPPEIPALPAETTTIKQTKWTTAKM